LINYMILLTGATGYIGGLLLGKLEARGHAIRCLARRPERLLSRSAPTTEVVAGDCLDEESLDRAMSGVTLAYYLVHSMGGPGSFEDVDREAARRFAAAAATAGVRRIVYLGGLGEGGDSLSAHLRSRRETGEALRAAGVPVVEFRCSIVIGAGSLSFDMVRALVERLPVMITPRWVAVKAQPIAVEDVLGYLVAAAEDEGEAPAVCEIGGPDVVSYGDIMREYARQRGLARRMIPVPLLTPRLSSLWLRLVTPLYANVGRQLIEGVRNRTVVVDPEPARRYAVTPRGLRQAVSEAIRQRVDRVETLLGEVSGTDAAGPLAALAAAGCLLDSREVASPADSARAFVPVRTIGGENGWYYANSLWRIRGWMDRALGGIGLRRGRRNPETCAAGDALDFWRVVTFEPDHRLTLAAEMKLPGRAWLQFDVFPAPDGTTRVRQTALFDPKGVLGLLYWLSVLPAHAVVFRGMLRGVAARGAMPASAMPSTGQRRGRRRPR
jgi:uncharacterized protein YbjT (DUF2867 family)